MEPVPPWASNSPGPAPRTMRARGEVLVIGWCPYVSRLMTGTLKPHMGVKVKRDGIRGGLPRQRVQRALRGVRRGVTPAAGCSPPRPFPKLGLRPSPRPGLRP
ncbi:hypothetical protein GCM10009680_30970 [Streptomyces yatensis]|uniref:Uncharacterized protein n=1 Tax=Streptomyces yatensis TaxID=155177 RepID=A0ABN2HK09_9ACTN